MYSSVNAATYYVATNGNNSNPGTLSQPWLTIQYAADHVAPGDVIYIRAGTYAKWKVNVSGTSGNTITFRNYAGELPVIDGDWVNGPGVEIRGVSYITIDGIRFYQISGNGVHIEGSEIGPSYASDPASDIIIRNCQIDGTSNAGIYCAGLIMGQSIPVDEYRVFNVTIENNDITNTNYPSGGNECISLGGGTNGFIIRNNHVHDSEQYGIDAKFGAINGQIYGNVVHDMEKHGIYLDTNSRTIDNVDVYDNFVYDCGGNGICLTRESRREPKVPNLRNIRIYDNVIKWCYRGILCYILNEEDPFTGDFKNITIVNNTIHDNMNPSGGTDNRSIKIIDISKIANHEGWIVANNLTSVNSGPALINSSGADWVVTNNINSATDAPYVDADNLDFHLVNGSVADNAGNATYLAKSNDYDGVTRGTPPDCGAFEYVGISLPSPWQNQDIGAVGAAGSAGYSSGVFTVDGSGADVWGTADEFHYVYQQVSGDIEIIARVPSQENVHAWAKSGVMIRETLAAGSKNAFMFITPNYGFRFQSRDATDGTSVSTDGGSINTAPNNWVRLVRSGNSITAYKSSNGTSWTQVGTAVTISMTTSVYVGMSVCSHNDGVLCTTEFDNVQVISTTIPDAPSSLGATAVSSSQINLTWTDNAADEQGFKIERKTGAGSYSEIVQLGANVTSYSNTGLSASTIYTYRVRAYNTAGNSSYSNEASATTQSDALLIDDFEDGNADGWTVESGTWTVVTDGATKRYSQTSTASEYRTNRGSTSWTDYSFEVDVKPVIFSGNCGNFINFRYTDNNNTYRVTMHGYSPQLRLAKRVSGTQTDLATKEYTWNTGTVYNIKIEVVGTSLKVYVNDVLELSATDASLSSGKIALATWKTSTKFDNVLVESIGGLKSASFQQATKVEPELETDYTLGCYPNPFNATTSIQFGIPPSGEGKIVVLKVYDTLGRLVSTLVNDNLSSGLHAIEFNASGLTGDMYIFRLQSGDRVLTQRAILMK